MPARTVYLGNRAAVAVEDSPSGSNGETGKIRRPLELGKTRTEVRIPDGTSLGDAFTAITHPDGVWANHSDEPPAWVASDDGELANLLSVHFDGAEIRDPMPEGERGEFDASGTPVGAEEGDDDED